MSAAEMQKIGEAFLPAHIKDRWRREVARITRRTKRTVWNWQAVDSVPGNKADLLRIANAKEVKRKTRATHENLDCSPFLGPGIMKIMGSVVQLELFRR